MTRVAVNPKNGKTVECALDDVEAVRRLAGMREDQFAQSLAQEWARKRDLSPAQWYWAHVIANRMTPEAPAVAAVPLAAGAHAKLLALFQTADTSGLQRPLINVHTVAGNVRFYRGRSSKVLVGCGDRLVVGVITLDDVFQPNKWCADNTREVVRIVAVDPIAVFALLGKETGACCFCRITLTDDRSVAVGYGPKCAERWGLPWGGQHDSDE